MSSTDKQIEDIQRELTLTRLDFSTRLSQLEQKIEALQQTNATNSQSAQTVPNKTSISTTQEPSSSVTTTVQIAAFSEKASPLIQASQIKEASKPSFISLFIQDTSQQVLSFLSPLTKFTSPLIHLYQHYQTKGQGPIFVFMLIGIVLLVAGFGYLTQLLVGELGAGSKSLLLFIVSMAITLSGAYLAKRNKFPEFSSAIVGLGLLLSYVTIYMAGSFYQLLPDWAVLLSYFSIAGMGFVYANKFDTKIVSTLSVMGGAAIPLISQLDQLGTSYYLVGLSFILITSLYQAISKDWPWLSFISIIMTYTCLEFLLVFSPTVQLIAFFSQVFYCLFLYYLYRLLEANSQFSKNIITLSVIILFTNIGICYQSDFVNSWILPALAGINVLISCYLIFSARQQKSYTTSLHTMFTSTWLLVAIISSLAPDYWGIAIALEGLFILYFALKENYLSVRIEAYALLAFAILHALFAVLPYFPDPALLTIKGNLVVLSIGGIIFISRKLLSTSVNINAREIRLKSLLRPIESVWLSLFVLSLLWVHLNVWMAIAVLPLQVWLLAKTYRTNCKTSEIMAYIASAVAVAICILGINEVQSISFRDLPNYTKAALIFVFAESWLFAEFYRRTKRTGSLANLAEIFRLAFYLILPLIFLPSVIKHYVAFSALAFWTSAAIAYVLGCVIKHRFIRTESLLLFGVAAVYNLGFYLDFYHNQLVLTSFATLVGLLVFSYFMLKANQRHAPLLVKKVASIGLYFVAGCITIYMQEWTNFIYAAALTTSYIFALTLNCQLNSTLTRNRRLLGYLSFISIVISWLTIAITSHHLSIRTSIWLALSITMSLVFLLNTGTLNRLHLSLFNDSKTGYSIQHVFLSLSGALLLIKWELTLLITPWLILHGSYLFFTHKHSKFIAKLALGFIGIGLLKLGLIDAANALLWQKVALMIGIGIFMLAAAFTYQKRINQTNTDEPNELV